MYENPLSIVRFLQELELLKNAHRTAWSSTGRPESVAEHSWRMAMFALVLEPEFLEADMARVMRLCLVHDLGEALEGDLSATIPVAREEKLATEKRALLHLVAPLSAPSAHRILALWDEYNSGETVESRIAKAIDKMETIIQHNQGKNPDNFDYSFNLEYGRSLAGWSDVLSEIRQIIDSQTEARQEERDRRSR